MSGYLAVSIIGTLVTMVTSEVAIKPLSSLYLPSTFWTATDPGQYVMGEEAIKNFAYDEQNQIAYTMGRKALQVVDVSNPSNMTRLFHVILDDVGADVTVCNGHVLALIRSRRLTQRGNVVIYKPFDRSKGYLEKITQIQVHEAPKSIKTTRDCRTAIVTNEGEPEVSSGVFTDPDGSISVITFNTAGQFNNHQHKQVTFTKFNDKKAELVKKGVRFIYPGDANSNKLSQDLEPESITFSTDETKAYVTLQENNALAVLDMASAQVTDILPLGYTSWETYGLDGSDKDGGIKIKKWPIRGLYQPADIMFFRQGGVDYLVTANKGAIKRYTQEAHGKIWSEAVRGATFVNSLAPALNGSIMSALSDDTKLGRLLFTSVNDKDSNGKYTNLYTFGTRSFSIRKLSDLSIVYDSGKDIEERHKLSSFWYLFNSGYGDKTKLPTDEMDHQSDNQGPEPTSLEIVEVDGVTYMFLGNAKVSSIMVYSLSDVTSPVFEGLYRNGETDQTWENLYKSRKMGDIDPRDLRFVPAKKSATGKDMLLAVGAVSGTISAYDVQITKTTTQPTPTTNIPEQATGTTQQEAEQTTTKTTSKAIQQRFSVSVLSILLSIILTHL